MKKYQVIGGQYVQVWYGESESIIGAKRIATKNIEYWDNWQGWNTPKIYIVDDCYEREGKIYHRFECKPLYLKHNNKWEKF